jgi:LacI family transcriptional regulator
MRIFLLFSQNNKPDRERMAGFLRYNAMQAVKWDVRTLDGSSSALYDRCRRLCIDWNPDAFVFSEYELFQNLQHSFPCLRRTKYRIGIDVHLDKRPAKVRQIALDNRQLVASALDLFVKRGYRHFAFVGTEVPDERMYSRDVENTFRTTLQASGKHPSFFRFGFNQSLTLALSEASAWLRALPKPCGVLAYSDEIAQQIIIACKLSNIVIPQQISVIGVDNHEDICETSQPTLTSILPDFEQSGYLAGMLLSRLSVSSKRQSHQPERLYYGIKGIYERETTQDLRNSGRFASAIQEIIRSEGTGQLPITSIAKRLNASVRLLEMHFKSVTGHTIRDELMRFRCTQLREKILTEHRPLTELALSCGFRTVNAAQVAFRKTFGHSMSECKSQFAEKLEVLQQE